MPEPDPAAVRPELPPQDDPQLEFRREYTAQLQKYEGLRYKVSLGLLVACPALVLAPPRKLDFYTFGLGSVWLYCLSEVTGAHRRNMWRGFRRYEDIPRSMAPKPEEEGVKVAGWMGEKNIKDIRNREENASSIGGLIMEHVWDVWEQRDRDGKDKKGGPEVSLREEVEKIEVEKDVGGSERT